MSHQLREYRDGGQRRRLPERLANRLAALSDLAPSRNGRRPAWSYLPHAAWEEQGEAPGDANGPNPDPPVPALVAPVPADPPVPAAVVGLSADLKEKVAGFMEAGIGRAAAARHIGSTLRDICAAVVADPVFRARVETAESACTDDCMTVIYEAAMQGSVSAALAHVKLTNDKKASDEALRQSGRLVDHSTAAARIDLGSLDHVEYERLRGFSERLARGDRLGPAESIEYSQLMGKAMADSGPIRDVRDEAERLFNLDDGD